jgi:hypothetical protein
MDTKKLIELKAKLEKDNIDKFTIEVPVRNVEKIEEIKPIKRKKSAAESYRGWLQGRLQICRNEDNKTMEMVYQEMIDKFKDFFPDKIIKIIIIEGWKKHNGEFPVHQDINDDYIIEIWHNEGKELKRVPKENMQKMLNVIRQLDVGGIYKCYHIAKLLGYEWKEIWKERMGVYFPAYYAPLKIFNELGVINYGGNRKSIVRLR